uniref:Uncharacterized protein n=1 Tax=Arundo donax TaxID=35708 RepID=A0A0A9FNU8_ARUDO
MLQYHTQRVLYIEFKIL